MCGLAGIFGPESGHDALRGRALAMRDRLRHRGPDDIGLFLDEANRVSMVHTRLSILDLSDAGHQPMSTEDGRFTIVFNGEIYNFQSLRRDLERAGTSLRSQSDTEVLLRLYQRHGRDCLERLEGMFAFAVWDNRDKTCFLARDPFGIKPLYLWHFGDQFAFASEIRALIAADFSPPRLCDEALAEYLIAGSVQEPRTLVDGITMLPAGHYAIWRASCVGPRMQIERYWDIDWNCKKNLVTKRETAAELTRHALDDSIRRHFISDVPVGIFLSGGIDSNALLALAQASGFGQLQTFSIGFGEASFDEGRLAARSAQYFGTNHHDWIMTPSEGSRLLDRFFASMDQPSNDGFNTYCVSKLASDHGLKVVLSGLGGDELLGGYPSFDAVPNLVRWGKAVQRLGPLKQHLAALLRFGKTSRKLCRLAAYLEADPDFAAAYWTVRGFFTPREIAQLSCCYTDRPSRKPIDDLLHQPLPYQPSDKDYVGYLELTRYMKNQLLRDSDVMSMAHGLELRVPLVDRSVAMSLRQISPHLRYASGKRLMLDAVPEIPEWIADQPKRGFRFPFDRWINSHWQDAFASIDAWSPVSLGQWYRRWILLALNHFIRENRIAVAVELP